jgi:hypothetical protein
VLTVKDIIHSMRLPRSQGACFGVADPSRLRPSRRFRLVPKPSCYKLEFADPKRLPVCFSAKNNRVAFRKVRQELEICGRLTAKAFREAGGLALYAGDAVVIGDIPDP